ncbi:hypothetical protein EN844_19900 [Mesorhizobium sp. M3A.F.Ca.ET.201.01.1.1]|nr:hypothetical protein EN844_19900 [Mesorhizobium sp. M3A.F.Ca.ET.201.01.1.1]
MASAAAEMSVPLMVSLAMPSGEEMVKVPVLCSDGSPSAPGAASSPEPSEPELAGRPFSLTVVSPP